jgi:uncharacterized membrane protein YgcG
MAATVPGAVGDVTYCLAPAADVDEASLSFPSGHAAMSFVGMTYAALALASIPTTTAAGRCAVKKALGMGVPPSQGPRGVSPWLAASCLPLAYAVYVSCTRVTDYKHRPADVVAGAAIGVASALACRPGGVGAWWLWHVASGGGGGGGGGAFGGGGDDGGDDGGDGSGGGGGGSGGEEMALIATHTTSV